MDVDSGRGPKSPESPGTKARKERPAAIQVPLNKFKFQPPAPEGAENGGVTPRSPCSARGSRKLLRSLDENTPTDYSPLLRPSAKHVRVNNDADVSHAAKHAVI